jgi:hypothetical protein
MPYIFARLSGFFVAVSAQAVDDDATLFVTPAWHERCSHHRCSPLQVLATTGARCVVRNATSPAHLYGEPDMIRTDWLAATRPVLGQGLRKTLCLAVLLVAAPLPAYAQAPFSGTPIALPGTFEAEDFDHGGEGVAYHDNVAGNAGGQYRTDESVDIIVSRDPDIAGYAVNNFETGEWLAYTVDVAAAGLYEIDLRVASGTFTTSAFRIEIDGADVTGRVTVPATGSFGSFQWVGKTSVELSAGQHVLKLVAVEQYFNVNQIRLAPVLHSPFGGTPIALPGTFEAEDFDEGGEGQAYHDNVAGNAGGQYRTAEDVDIVVSRDPEGGDYVVNNFETGEWLVYTVEIAAAGSYDIELRLASGTFTTSAFHVELDGADVTGSIVVPATGSFGAFQWVGKKGVALPAGRHVLRLVSDQQYFDVNRLRVLAAAPTQGSAGLCPPGNTLCASFENGYAADGFGAQLKDPSRAQIVSVPGIISGSKALRLWTSGSDCGADVRTTCPQERAEILLTPEQTGGVDTADNPNAPSQWWAHSVYTPADFQMPLPDTNGNNVQQFHASNTAGVPDYGSGQPNVNINFTYIGNSFPSHIAGCPAPPGGYNGHVLYVGAHAGPNLDPDSTTRRQIAEKDAGCRQAIYLVPKVGPETRKQLWYDFVHHVRWASDAPVGFHRVWLRVRDEQGNVLPVRDVNGVQVNGPALVMNKTNIYTKYPDKPVYLKAGTYHGYYGNVVNSVVHDRVVRGPSFASVAPFACPAGDSLCQ